MKKILICLLAATLLCSCREQSFKIDTSEINVLTDNATELDFKLHSDKYLLVDLSDFIIKYKHRSDVIMYPASLTKVLTMDTVLNLVEDLDETSYVTYEQVEALIEEDASLAYIKRDYPYSLRDLLYALILPSGADASLALENYFSQRGIDLVEQMNIHAQQLGCTNSHFVNTTGLHDDDHYTTLDDLFLIVMDTLKFAEGRAIIESLHHVMDDGLTVSTGIRSLNVSANTIVLGGKTGYTPEAGQNIVILYKNRGKSYMLLLGNADGSYLRDEYWHYEDALTVLQQLY
ncbi:MAG: D-alanyl-D-alanine carboxypeptidase [Erysipelotrichaceae bacterium]|nr:D-alanyl-D-alanine carboxypeptidase [Erysipelotrichaceae bacterium]